MGDMGEIKPPQWKGRNENLKFINIADEEVPLRRRKISDKYKPYYDQLIACNETGQAFKVECEDEKEANRIRWTAWFVKKKFKLNLTVVVRGKVVLVRKSVPADFDHNSIYAPK